MSGSMPASAKEKILVALDLTTIEAALELVEELKDQVGGFKVGLELCTSAGTPRVIEEISQAGGRVFLDLKFKDIPNTIKGACRAATQPGVLMFNVHCDGGLEMMKAASQAAYEVSQAGQFKRPLVIGVTVLTSVDKQVMNQEMNVPGSVETQAVHLATLAKAAGLDGVVCSAYEVEAIKAACGVEFITVVPGVRPTWASSADQKRVMTPAQAISQGADYLVIGRPITNPPPSIKTAAQAAQSIVDEVNSLCSPASLER